MSGDFIQILRQLSPTGPHGFEGLVARLLERLTGRCFFLARAGSQGGRDISSDFKNFSVVAVECKRYGKQTELEERSLLGEMVQASQGIPDLDLWVLVASRRIQSQLVTMLTTEARQRGLEFLPISAEDDLLSPLAVLCAQAVEIVLEYIQANSFGERREAVRRYLDEVIANPRYEQGLRQLRATFSPAIIGYDHWRVSQNAWLTECFRSEDRSRAAFAQPVNVADEGVRFVERRVRSEE